MEYLEVSTRLLGLTNIIGKLKVNPSKLGIPKILSINDSRVEKGDLVK